MTLTICSLFAIASAFAPTYLVLNILVVIMGFGVGGNIPVDGNLFIEFVPRKNQSDLALLSIFWYLFFD